MKRTILIALIAVLLSAILVGTAFAQGGIVVVKGEITDIGDSTLTIESSKDGTVVVTLPAGFDTSTLTGGDSVMIKATKLDDGSLLAISVRILGGQSQGKGNGKPENAGKASSAYCSTDKQGKLHPLAVKIAADYNVDTEWVMSYYCNGQSMGAIMLALKTSQLVEGANPDGLLAQRAEGEGWGKIWQGLKLIGNEKEVTTPLGQLKK